ncbi:MAG: DUF5687 family protein [Bacteroidales bacterium]
MYQLLIHYWKEKIRSPFWQKSVFINVVLGILALYLMLNCLALSYFADEILKSAFPNQQVLFSFNRLLLYYFLFDIVLRFFLQQLPVIAIQPYLSLPIKKSTLLHFPLLRSVFSFFNLVGLILVVPFFIKVIVPSESLSYCIFWLITVLSLIFVYNFLNFSLKKYFTKKSLLVIICIMLIGTIIFLDSSGFISIPSLLSNYFANYSQYTLLVLVPMVVLVAFYYMAYMLLKKNSYIESTGKNGSSKVNKMKFLANYGIIGSLIGSEMKLILRNKRPKSMLYLSAFFLLYGFIFYQKVYMNNPYMMAFVGIFLTSTLAMFYYQFVFSWESSFFDTFLVHRIPVSDFVSSKYYLFAMMCTLSYIVTLPYAFVDYKIAFINTAMVLFNIGVSSIVLFYFGSFSNSFIDLGKSQFMNYQGTGAHHFLMMLPLFGIPMLIILPFHIFGLEKYSFYAIALVGIVAIVFHKYLISFISHQLIKRKYRMACGFRQ